MRLANPPHGVGDEFKAPGFVKALGGFDKAEVALVDEVAQAKALVLVLLGHRHHEAQVGFGQFFQRLLVAVADALRQRHFLVGREQIHFANLLEVLIQRLAFAVGNLLADF